MAQEWDSTFATGDELVATEWNDHVTDQKQRGFDSLRTVTTNITANYEEVILVDASSNAITITLPTPDSGRVLNVKVIDATNTVTIATPGSETIDGGSSRTITSQYISRTLVSDGSNYFII